MGLMTALSSEPEPTALSAAPTLDARAIGEQAAATADVAMADAPLCA